VPVATIKRHATGKGNAPKEDVIRAVRAQGFLPKDGNEADALALLAWAIANEIGGAKRANRLGASACLDRCRQAKSRTASRKPRAPCAACLTTSRRVISTSGRRSCERRGRSWPWSVSP
jgi:hypothetical protein